MSMATRCSGGFGSDSDLWRAQFDLCQGHRDEIVHRIADLGEAGQVQGRTRRIANREANHRLMLERAASFGGRTAARMWGEGGWEGL